MNTSNSLTPAMRILFMTAGAAITLWGMSSYASYICSAGLAIIIVLAAGPMIDWLRHRGINKVWILVITLLVSLLAVGALLVFLLYAGAQFARQLPAYQQQAAALAQQFQTWLEGLGLDSAGASAVAGQTSLETPLNLIDSLLGTLVSTLGNGVTLLLIMIFMFVDVILFPGRLAALAAHGNSYAQRVGDFTGDLRQYIVVMVVICVAIGTLNSIYFMVLGVPLALLWGVLSGLLNFIPFIGFWFGLLPPAILTLLAYGPERMLVVAVGYIVINGFVQNVIQPRMVVVKLNLTPFMSLLSSTFWPLVLGPVGAIIGVPLTMAVHTLLFDADPATRWLADMMGTKVPGGDATGGKPGAGTASDGKRDLKAAVSP